MATTSPTLLAVVDAGADAAAAAGWLVYLTLLGRLFPQRNPGR